jgi:hypothetical protein
VGFSFGVNGSTASAARIRVVANAIAATTVLASQSNAVDFKTSALYSVSVKFGDDTDGVVKIRRDAFCC